MITKTTLDNGVRVLSEAVSSVRSIAVGVWIDSGSRNDPERLAGISHFVEHTVFKGTAKRRMHQIASRMESVGGYMNAFTSKEHTCYFARALDSYLTRSVDTTCDLVASPVFPEREIEKEKGVVLEEIKMYEDTPDEYIADRFESVIYPAQPIGRPIIGYPKTVSRLKRDDLCEYVDRQYIPDQIVVAASGNLRHKSLLKSVEKAFQGLRPTGLRGPEKPEILPYKPVELSLTRPIQQGHLILGRRGITIHSKQRAVLEIINTILGGGSSSRLNQRIRERHGFCYSVYSFLNMYSDCGDFGVYVGLDASRIERSITLIFREFDRLAQTPVSNQVLNRAKGQARGGIALGLESMSNRMARLGKQELHFGRIASMDEIIAELESVTADEIQTFAAEFLHPEKFSRVMLVPSL
ncbi:MAG: pitrilysin family protein [Bacteroidetes bacterium]|nr:pitrilysin family protein [Bacteroidota bacterium]